ncbi:MAG: hypothetical protein U1F36_19975 [Planctomycetota bacterium]
MRDTPLVLSAALIIASTCSGQANCPECNATMAGVAYPQTEAVGIWIPGPKTKGTCTGSPCAPAETCRFNFTAGVVVNAPGDTVVVHTTYTQQMPTGQPLLVDYPPFFTGSFRSEALNYPVVCGGEYTTAVTTSNVAQLPVLDCTITCSGCQS